MLKGNAPGGHIIHRKASTRKRFVYDKYYKQVLEDRKCYAGVVRKGKTYEVSLEAVFYGGLGDKAGTQDNAVTGPAACQSHHAHRALYMPEKGCGTQSNLAVLCSEP